MSIDTTSIKATDTLRVFRSLGEPPRVRVVVPGDEVLQIHALASAGLVKANYVDGIFQAKLSPKGEVAWDVFFDVVEPAQ